jgi:hypothetical protein
MNLERGMLVYAHREAGVARLGEVGVCYDVYPRPDASTDSKGYGLLFARGGYDGFSLFDISVTVTPLRLVHEGTRAYNFSNVVELYRDYSNGRFNAAFAAAEDYLVINGWAKDRQAFLLWLHGKVHRLLKAFAERCSPQPSSARVRFASEQVRYADISFFDERGEVINVARAADDYPWETLRRNVSDLLRPVRGTYHYYLNVAVMNTQSFTTAFVVPFPSLRNIQNETY